ncbi:MAG: glutaryl-7-ACA acylase, partial [Novosphingobium sp.]
MSHRSARPVMLSLLAASALAVMGRAAVAQDSFPPSDIPAKFTPPQDARDYVKREVMIPMRDGTKLYTVIVYPKGTT